MTSVTTNIDESTLNANTTVPLTETVSVPITTDPSTVIGPGTVTQPVSSSFIDTSQFLFNAMISPKDDRDWTIKKLLNHKKVPKTFSLKSKMLPIREADTSGSCVSQAIATIIEFHENSTGVSPSYYSQKFIYDRRSAVNDGMTSRNALSIVLQSGTCKDEDYGTNQADTEAAKHKITSYATIKNMKYLKRSIYENGPALLILPVINPSEEKGMFWCAKKPEDKILGYHAVVVVGWNKKSFVIRNNWGPTWNGDGYCKLKYKDFEVHQECWAVIDITNKHIPEKIASCF